MTVRKAIGLAVLQTRNMILLLMEPQKYFSLLPATTATLVTMPDIEVTAATIGLQDRAVAPPPISDSKAAMSKCIAAAVRADSLSAVSRSNF